ncbi:MAG: L-rhamnose mutarotase [Lentisphaeria bacterium]|jgi:L-rhamnose mutarotase|nr:L-rhamnose mutarotase [Lentisphaeria bacterium]MDP7741059.1 L-rhamnose mutarotase [Lentisphaeria bacterium]
MRRRSFVPNVKDGQDEYIRRHQAAWTGVLDDLRRAGIHNITLP